MISENSDEENLQPIIVKRRRIYKERINFQPNNFAECFRLTPSQAEEVIRYIGNLIRPPTMQNCALSPQQQLLLALRFLASGSFYNVIGDAHGPHKSSVCRSIKKVIMAINETLFDESIRWPSESSQLRKIPQAFFEIAGLPRVAGCVDGTLIRIKSPTESEENYVDRHGHHSINCMVVCGPSLKAYYVAARWPGRVNDQRVMRNSDLYRAFQSGWRPFPTGVILGDSGYALNTWLIPPIGGNPSDPLEQSFNSKHRSTRRIIECFFGVLKMKFQCLHYPLRVDPDYACDIFKACCVLQTMTAKASDNDLIDNSSVIDDDFDGPVLEDNDQRRSLIENMH